MKAASPRKPAFPTPYLFFGGKGGVGKTTCAAATALLLLEQAKPGERILLFSTDPAHSLSDSLAVPLGNQIREVTQLRGASLDAWEMDAHDGLERFKQRHRAILAEIANRGTMLDTDDINELLNLSLPGMDEVMALFELSQFDRNGSYSHIVVDTAPSGHTTRMLELPAIFERWIETLDLMSAKHRFMIEQIAHLRGRRDEADVFIGDLSERLKRVREILYSAERSSFVIVTIPEAMAVDESVRYLERLRKQNVPVTDIVVNRVEHPHPGCRFCAARTAAQHKHLDHIQTAFGSLKRHDVPVLAGEVRGLRPLRSFAAALWDTERKSRATGKPEIAGARIPVLNTGSELPELRRMLIIGGKGGVGKTTVASALALRLAEANPDRRFLLFSTDPAHSLSDSFAEPIGEFKEGVAGYANLDAIEIDAVARFDQLKEKYRKWIEDLFSAITGGSNWEVRFDREAMQELISLAPPGIDEIAALSAVSDLLEKGTYTSVILDTAPTGHLLRFLELPEVALSWVRTFIRLLLKYREFVTSSDVAEELIALSRSIKKVIAILTDAEKCRFSAVAIPERMSLAETQRLAAGIETRQVRLAQVIVNNVIPDEAAASCPFCRERRIGQEGEIGGFRKAFAKNGVLMEMPQFAREIRGPEALREFAITAWPPRKKAAGVTRKKAGKSQ